MLAATPRMEGGGGGFGSSCGLRQTIGDGGGVPGGAGEWRSPRVHQLGVRVVILRRYRMVAASAVHRPRREWRATRAFPVCPLCGLAMLHFTVCVAVIGRGDVGGLFIC